MSWVRWKRQAKLDEAQAKKAADGMLLFGISTAYVFAVMQLYWPMLQAIRQR